MTSNANTHDAKILEELRGIRKALEAIVALKLSEEFYPKEERSALYKQADALYDEDRAAYERVQNAAPKDGLSWEQMVAQFGEDGAMKQRETLRQAVEEKKNAYSACEEFDTSHPLLRNIRRTRDMLLKPTI